MSKSTFTTDAIFTSIAIAQHGVASRRQLVTAGVTGHSIDRRIAAGLWVPVAPGIFRSVMSERTWAMDATAGIIEAHPLAVFAGRTALAMHGLTIAVDPDLPPTILVPHQRTHDSAVAEIRQVSNWPESEIVILNKENRPGRFVFRATTPARSLVDLAVWTPTSSWDAYERLLDTAHRLNVASYGEVRRSHEHARTLRRRGLRRLGSLLDARTTTDGASLSELEGLARRKFQRYGVAHLIEWEVPHPAYPGSSRRADAICRATRTIFEFDSRTWHLRNRQFDLDRARDAKSLEAGWKTVRLTWSDFTANNAPTRGRVRRFCGLDGGLRPAA